MRKLIAAVAAVATTLQFTAPAMAAELFNRNTMLGWRQQTGPAVVAYFRAPIGPGVFKANARTGLALTGPRSYTAGESPLFSQGPRLLDFAMTRHESDGRWNAQLAVGNGVAWTNTKDSLQHGQVNLMESGLSWVAVGAVTAALAVGTMAFIEKD